MMLLQMGLKQLLLLLVVLLLLRLVDYGCRTGLATFLLLQRDVVGTDERCVELVARDGRDAVRGGTGRRLRRTRPVHHRAGIRAAAVAAADELLLAERLAPVADARFAVLVLGHGGKAAVGYQQDILRLLLLLLVVLLKLLVLLLLLLLER